MESSEIDLEKYCQLIFDKGGIAIQWKKESFQQIELEWTVVVHMRNTEPRQSPYTSKWTINLNVRQKDKTSRRKNRRKSMWPWLWQWLFRYNSKTRVIKDFVKLTNGKVREVGHKSLALLLTPVASSRVSKTTFRFDNSPEGLMEFIELLYSQFRFTTVEGYRLNSVKWKDT